MSSDRVKIIEASYDADKDLAKIKVLKLDSNEEVVWALIGESFDSLVGQITNTSLEYLPQQRTLLCTRLANKEFINQIEIEIENADVDTAKDKSMDELRHSHDTIDKYPLYEIQQEAIEDAKGLSEETEK